MESGKGRTGLVEKAGVGESKKEKRKAVEISEENGDEAEPSGSNKKVSKIIFRKRQVTNSCFTDKSKINWS